MWTWNCITPEENRSFLSLALASMLWDIAPEAQRTKATLARRAAFCVVQCILLQIRLSAFCHDVCFCWSCRCSHLTVLPWAAVHVCVCVCVLYVHLCMCSAYIFGHRCICVYTCVDMYVEDKGWDLVSFWSPSILFFEMRSFTEAPHLDFPRLAGHGAQGIVLPLAFLVLAPHTQASLHWQFKCGPCFALLDLLFTSLFLVVSLFLSAGHWAPLLVLSEHLVDAAQPFSNTDMRF